MTPKNPTKPFSALERARARASDPFTSKLAAATVDVAEIRARVRSIFVTSKTPLTDTELCGLYRARGWKASDAGIRGRRSELVALGYLGPSGFFGKTKYNRTTIKWTIVAGSHK